MKTYTVKKVCGAPDWSLLPTLAIDHWNTEDRADVRAWAQIAYDENQLWVLILAALGTPALPCSPYQPW